MSYLLHQDRRIPYVKFIVSLKSRFVVYPTLRPTYLLRLRLRLGSSHLLRLDLLYLLRLGLSYLLRLGLLYLLRLGLVCLISYIEHVYFIPLKTGWRSL